MTPAQERFLRRVALLEYLPTDDRPDGLLVMKGDVVLVREFPMSRIFMAVTPEGRTGQVKSIWRAE